MGTVYKITELAKVIRSKNAGPFELTLDIIFNDQATYDRVRASGQINGTLISQLYQIPEAKIISFVEFAPAHAIKITIERPLASGDIGETDVYGAQQHGPLLGIQLEL